MEKKRNKKHVDEEVTEEDVSDSESDSESDIVSDTSSIEPETDNTITEKVKEGAEIIRGVYSDEFLPKTPRKKNRSRNSTHTDNASPH